MNKTASPWIARLAAAGAVAAAGLLAAGGAQARSNVTLSVGIGVPGVVVGAPVYSAPYVAPAPVYMAPPRPIYYAPPRPVYYAPPPPVYYGPPAYRPAPVVVVPAPRYYDGPRYWRGPRHSPRW